MRRLIAISLLTSFALTNPSLANDRSYKKMRVRCRQLKKIIGKTDSSPINYSGNKFIEITEE